MSSDWTIIEVDLIVTDYFSMLRSELAAIPYNKTTHRNNLKEMISRSSGAIEFKHQNISAVLIELGGIPIRGYKPAYNYQTLLKDRVLHYISSYQLSVERLFENYLNQPISDSGIGQLILENPPPTSLFVEKYDISKDKNPFKINYLEREQTNIVIGSKGEEFVILYEENRLIKLGCEDLAKKIEWIGKYDDGAGYDILSKNEDGSNKYIEVKTTKLHKETPIFFSRNEYNFSRNNQHQFNLYRVFDFGLQPKMFNVTGTYDDFCRKEIVTFKGFF